MEEINKKNFEKEIMDKIKSGKVSIKSKYIFLAEKLGFSSVLIFSIILLVLFLSLLIFYFKSTDNLFYLTFGSRGLSAFLESFPSFLIIYFIIIFFVTGLLLSKTEIAYKKSFSYLVIIFLLFIFSVSSLFAFSGMNRQIEYHFFNPNSPVGKKFRVFSENIDQNREHSIAGMVLYFEYPEVIVQLPVFENEVIVDLSKLENKKIVLEKGQFVIFLGDGLGERKFIAKDFKIVDEGDLSLIRNRTRENIDCNCQKEPLTKCQFMERPQDFSKNLEEECFKDCLMSDWASKEKCEECLQNR